MLSLDRSLKLAQVLYLVISDSPRVAKNSRLAAQSGCRERCASRPADCVELAQCLDERDAALRKLGKGIWEAPLEKVCLLDPAAGRHVTIVGWSSASIRSMLRPHTSAHARR
jgi:hypothetical protein